MTPENDATVASLSQFYQNKKEGKKARPPEDVESYFQVGHRCMEIKFQRGVNKERKYFTSLCSLLNLCQTKIRKRI